MLIVGRWLSIPLTEDKDTLDSVPIELFFYSRPVVVAILLVPTRPDAPSPPVACRPPVTSPFSSSEFPQSKTPRPPPARSGALVLSPSLAASPAPVDAGGGRPVGGSESSMIALL